MKEQILIAAPSELEFDFYLPYLDQSQKRNLPMPAYSGLIGKHNIVLAQIGLGKLNAGLNAWQILQNKQLSIKKVFLVGVAGISPEAGQVGDICLANYVFNSDLSYLFDGLERESLNIQIPNSVFKSDAKLLKDFKNFSFSFPNLPPEVQAYNGLYGKKRINSQLIEGVCASGDCFFQGFQATNWPEKRAKEITTAQNYSFTEMEAAAILQVTQAFEIPALIIKIASNYDRPWSREISGQESLKMGLKFIPQMAALQAEFMANYFRFSI